MKQLEIFLILIFLFYCKQESMTEMMRKLQSCDKTSICLASYYFGEQKDKSVTKELLKGIEDVRISHNLRFNRMSVYYCKMIALRKISGLDAKVRPTDKPDPIKIKQFINWAIKNKLIGSNETIDTKSCVNSSINKTPSRTAYDK